MRRVLQETLASPVASRNRRSSQGSVRPPAPTPAPDTSGRQPPAVEEPHAGQPSDSRSSTATAKIHHAPPMEKRHSSSHSSKGVPPSFTNGIPLNSTERASPPARRDNASHSLNFAPRSGGAGSSQPGTPAEAEIVPPSRPSQSTLYQTSPSATALGALSAHVASPYRAASSAMAAPAPVHAGATPATAIPISRATSSTHARPSTQPPMASGSSVSERAKSQSRRSESLQRETRARRETREHWERMQTAGNASNSHQPAGPELPPHKQGTELDHRKEDNAAEDLHRGRSKPEARRENRHGKARTVTYATFEAAQNGLVPQDWTRNTERPASPADRKGKRRASTTSSLAHNSPDRTGHTSQPSERTIKNTPHVWDPPPPRVYRLHARRRPPVDPVAYIATLMRRSAGARRTLQHVPRPDDSPLRTLPATESSTRSQQPPAAIYAATAMQHALLPLRGAAPRQTDPLPTRPLHEARRESMPRDATHSHHATTKAEVSSYERRSTPHGSSSRIAGSRTSSPINSPRSTVAARTTHHVHTTSSHQPKSARIPHAHVEDLPLHHIYSRFAPVSSLHPPATSTSHRFTPISHLHPPIPPPPPEAAPVYAYPASALAARPVAECSLPPEGPPVQARRQSRPLRRESDPLDLSSFVPPVPRLTEHVSGRKTSASPEVPTEFRRALNSWRGCPHDLWVYTSGPGQCLGCLELLGGRVYRCEGCGAVACTTCRHDKF
ncbi:hypothetical protein BD626DRAFT_151079 [Schizophyllum amplum]|uniref:Uncharacterized protein n=1 Tax=Schizophyllum amplum TaxID=97359 RepID=A0A550C472_9AGAR|nr:hypothetical protein BD626DRAFT_151079 [Auriculariopsis ampla]